jgi:hypothetical protein
VLPFVGASFAAEIRGLCCTSHRLQYQYFLVDHETIKQMKQEALQSSSDNKLGEITLFALNDVVNLSCRHAGWMHGGPGRKLSGQYVFPNSQVVFLPIDPSIARAFQTCGEDRQGSTAAAPIAVPGVSI